jgi:hypothetical protein
MTQQINSVNAVNLSNSAYVRIKVRNKPIVAKMLIDSGNLVNDLISEEFAKIIRTKYTPMEKKVGTAAKGGSVKIIGKSAPIRIFIEGVPQGVTITPLVVKDLSHPINVGRDFLGRNKGRLEFTPSDGYLEINQVKVRMIKKATPLASPQVVDVRFRKTFRNPGSYIHHHTEMIYEGTINQCEDVTDRPVPMYSRDEVEVPALSGMFVPITTRGKIMMKDARKFELITEPDEEGETPVLVVPGAGRLLKKEAFCFVINPEAKRIKIPAGSVLGRVYLNRIKEERVQEEESLNFISNVGNRELRHQIEKDLKINENALLNADPKTQKKVVDLFCQYGDIISRHEFDYGHTTEIQCQIQLKPGEEEPVKMKARPLNPAQEESLKTQLEEWEEGGIIERTQSPWAFPMVGVRKKNSEVTRWCVDYRLLNKKTVKDAYPLQSIESNLHKLQGAKIFSTLDSAGAYHSVEIHPESREYTAFITPFGQFQFARMPFGLSNAGACYSRLVSRALQFLPAPFALAYLDDIVIYSKSVSEHLEHLEQVLALHRRFGMKLRLHKCKVMQEEVEYLGHLVSAEGIQMVPSYVKKILDWPLPATGKELKQFLGFVGYYRGFIPDIAELTFEMNDMKKGNKLEWNDKTKGKFRTLKQRFETAPLRRYPDYTTDKPFVLDTDFSSTAMAAILSQEQDGQERFIGAGARKCNKAEQNYPSHKGELAAAVMGLRKFEHILRFKPFILRTDSRCMQFLDSLKEVRGIYARWLNFIQGFEFTVVHRPGVKNQNADPISRMERMEDGPSEQAEEEAKDLEEDVYQIAERDVSNMTGGEIVQWQESDPVLRIVMTWVRAGEKPSKAELRDVGQEYQAYAGVFECLQLTEDQGLVFKPTPEGRARVCVPQDAFHRIFRWAHEHATAGHFGMNATQKKIRERFFFPGMTARIVTGVTNCISCVQKRNYVNKNQHVFHRSLESRPFQKIYVDLVGPLTPGEWHGEKVSYVLTMMDGFTKWAEAIPVGDITAPTVAKNVVEHWIARYGIPEQIHSDRGVQFTSELYREVMRLFGIRATTTPPYNPRSNKVERLHRVLGEVLRSNQASAEKEWPEKLPLALFAHRTTVSRTTGVTPFQALFGINSRIPLDVIFPTPRGELEKWPDYVAGLQEKLQTIYEKMREQGELGLMRATAYQTGKVAKAIKVEEGDTVYYFSPRILPGTDRRTHKKLALLWTGPYQVRRVISASLCIIHPFGEWAKNPREILTVVDKIRIIRTPIPERALRPEQQIDLDEIEEDLENYGEFIQQNIAEPAEWDLPLRMGVPLDEITDRNPASEAQYAGVSGRQKSRAINLSPASKHMPVGMGGGGGAVGMPETQYREDSHAEESFSSQTQEEEDRREEEEEDRSASQESLFPSHSRSTKSEDEEMREHQEEEKVEDRPKGREEEEEATSDEDRVTRSEVQTPVTIESRSESQTSVGESSSSHRETRRKSKETKYSPYFRPPPRRAAKLAEALLRAGASQENLEMKQKKKSSRTGTQKRKMSESMRSEQQEKREKVQQPEGEEGDEEEERGPIMEESGEDEEEEEIYAMEEEEEEECSEEGECNYSEDDEIRIEKEVPKAAERNEVRGKKYYRDTKELKLPVRCVEIPVPVGRPGRSGIALNAGDIKKVFQKISEGVDVVTKVISFKYVGAELIDAKEEWIEERGGGLKESKIRSEVCKWLPGGLPDTRIVKTIKEIDNIMRSSPVGLNDTVPEMVYSILTEKPLLEEKKAFQDLEERMEEVTQRTDKLVADMEMDCIERIRRKEEEMKKISARKKKTEKELQECQEKLREIEDKYAKKEEEYAKLMEWSEKSREEQKAMKKKLLEMEDKQRESKKSHEEEEDDAKRKKMKEKKAVEEPQEPQRKELKKEEEKMGEGNADEESADGGEADGEDTDGEEEGIEEEEEREEYEEESEEEDVKGQEERIAKLEEQVIGLQKRECAILRLIQPECLLIKMPDELSQLPTGLARCKLRARISICGAGLELVQLYSPNGSCQVVASADGHHRGVTLITEKKQPLWDQGQLKIRVLYNPQGDRHWSPWKPGEALGKISLETKGQAERVRVDADVVSGWKPVQLAHQGRKPATGRQTKEARRPRHGGEQRRSEEERGRREHQPERWRQAGPSSYHSY